MYYENYILINIEIPNFEEIKKKYFDNDGNNIGLLNDNYSIQSPYEYFTPVMYVDPEGEIAISLGIGITIGIYELLAALGTVALILIVTILESKYHYFENGMNFLFNNLTSTIEDSFVFIKKEKYKRKKAAPRIKKKSKKEAKQAAFLKGGKKEPIFHKGKHGPHYHPNNPKYGHYHYYYDIFYYLYLLDKIDEEEDSNEQLYRIIYF